MNEESSQNTQQKRSEKGLCKDSDTRALKDTGRCIHTFLQSTWSHWFVLSVIH